MTLARVLVLLAVTTISGCTGMKPTDFKNANPTLRIETYFQGKTQAWGIFEDRFGTLRRQFTVDIDGSWDGKELVLDERFQYSDGETDRRVWTIRKTGAHSYEGSADDVIGVARGEAYGNALNWQYDMDLKSAAQACGFTSTTGCFCSRRAWCSIAPRSASWASRSAP